MDFIQFVNQDPDRTEFLWGWYRKDVRETEHFSYVQVAQHGGEGQGDNIWAVYKVTYKDGTEKLYKVAGWYASYDGSSYEETFEVVPKEVMKIEYERV